MPSPNDALIKIYEQAFLDVLGKLYTAAQADRSLAYYQALLADIAQIIAGLDPQALQWIQQNIPAAYQSGMQDAVTALQAAGVTGALNVSGMTGVHRAAVEILAVNLYGDLTDASQFMGRSVNDIFRQIGLDAVTQKISTGQTIPQSAKALQQALSDRGVTAFTDSRGHQWRLDTYAAMAIRSTTREATNRGTLNQLSSLGYDLVQVSTHFPTCELCIPYQGRIYSISGKDTRFPHIWNTAFSAGYANIHPNCSHVVTPYIEELADDVSGDIERSNQPFDVDSRTLAERQAYAAAQARKSAARMDFYQWERYRARLPDDTPTLAGFRRMKRANSQRYQDLQQLYRDAGQVIGV